MSQSIVDEAIYGGDAPIHTQRVNIELGSSTIAIVVGLMVIIAACGTVLGLNLARQAQMDADFKAMKTQEWLVERRLMDKEALDILNGTRLQSDTEFGPTGNLQRMKPK
jgi:hypothetical protein